METIKKVVGSFLNPLVPRIFSSLFSKDQSDSYQSDLSHRRDFESIERLNGARKLVELLRFIKSGNILDDVCSSSWLSVSPLSTKSSYPRMSLSGLFLSSGASLISKLIAKFDHPLH